MGGLPIVGDPDLVAQELANLSKAGLKEIGVSFVNYGRELPYFAAEVLPRVERLGLMRWRFANRSLKFAATASASRTHTARSTPLGGNVVGSVGFLIPEFRWTSAPQDAAVAALVNAAARLSHQLGCADDAPR
jgi:hypothetical protein